MNRLSRLSVFLPTIFFVVIAAGCSLLGVKPPENFEDHVANAYTALSTARDTSTALAQAGKIQEEDFADFIKQCDSAREAIQVSRVVHNIDQAAGQQRLEAAITMLNALNDYLERRKANPHQPEVSPNENRRPTADNYDLEYRSDASISAGVLAAASAHREPIHQRR